MFKKLLNKLKKYFSFNIDDWTSFAPFSYAGNYDNHFNLKKFKLDSLECDEISIVINKNTDCNFLKFLSNNIFERVRSNKMGKVKCSLFYEQNQFEEPILNDNSILAFDCVEKISIPSAGYYISLYDGKNKKDFGDTLSFELLETQIMNMQWVIFKKEHIPVALLVHTSSCYGVDKAFYLLTKPSPQNDRLLSLDNNIDYYLYSKITEKLRSSFAKRFDDDV